MVPTPKQSEGHSDSTYEHVSGPFLCRSQQRDNEEALQMNKMKL